MRALQAQHAEAAPRCWRAMNPRPAAAGARAGIPGWRSRRAGGRGRSVAAGEARGTFVRGERKVGRNEPCPCGSGKKYKHCHGALSSVE